MRTGTRERKKQPRWGAEQLCPALPHSHPRQGNSCDSFRAVNPRGFRPRATAEEQTEMTACDVTALHLGQPLPRGSDASTARGRPAEVPRGAAGQGPNLGAAATPAFTLVTPTIPFDCATSHQLVTHNNFQAEPR